MSGVLFSDLDGTMLDARTFQPGEATLRALELLDAAGVALVPVSSKTAAELHRVPGLRGRWPLAVMEGGAVLVHREGPPELLGRSRAELVEVLRELRDEGWPVRGFSQMDPGEVSRLTGLPEQAARAALDRLASEPFVFGGVGDAGLAAELSGRAAELGCRVVRGGGVWHLLGRGVDKGSGVERTLQRCRSLRGGVSGAVGDAWNDLDMFRRVDRAYLLGSLVQDAELPENVVRIPEPGPRGFLRAVRTFLEHVEAAGSAGTTG